VAQCEFKKPDGTTCKANAQLGKSLCVFHDPGMAAKVRTARRAGGVSRSRSVPGLSPDAPDHPLTNSAEVSKFLAIVINQTYKGQIDRQKANSIGHLSQVLLRALEQGPIDERLLKVEATVRKLQATKSSK
jgi:hypothetical protein